jgi:glycosyltransferase involved in cell wall biosynthesis
VSSSRDRPTIIDFVCHANLGRSDGGQETFTYQFIPALLERHPDAVVRVYGQRPEGKPDTSGELKAAVGSARDRLITHFFMARRTRWPLLFSMTRDFVRWKRHEENPTADMTIALGTVVELLMVLLSARARRSFKIVWLRTIFVDTKAYRIPRVFRELARRLDAAILARADLVLANGDDIAAYYRARGLDVIVIKNAVELANWRMPPPALGKPIHVAFVGRLSHEKGIREFLELARAIKSSPDTGEFEFHLVGSLGHEQLARESEGRGDITWHGSASREELPALVATMDVCIAFTFASPERGAAGTSNAMMEQLAAGRILLAWDNVIFRQWLNEINAYLVPQGDVPAAAAALREIASDRKAALRRASAGTDAVAPFDVRTMMSRFDDAVRSLRPDWGA